MVCWLKIKKLKKKEQNKLKKQEIQHISKLDKACFEYDIAYGGFTELNRRKVTDKVSRDKVFNIASNLKYSGYQRGLVSMVYKVFMKKPSCGTFKNEIISKKKLGDELHKPIIAKIEKWKVHSLFIDNSWGADLADTQLISKFDNGFRFLLSVYSKYAWIIPLKDKKEVTISNAFQNFLDESNHKPKRIWVHKGSRFYNRSMKSWLEKYYRNVLNTKQRKICCCRKFY